MNGDATAPVLLDQQPRNSQEIAVPPIIREAPIDLQNALPDDFVVSRQTPYSSGRNEVLIVSPSTGTEQRFEINLPGTTSGFRLYEASFSKVAIDDPARVVGEGSSLSPAQVQAQLESFTINFDSNNLPESVILADGTEAEFSASGAVIRSADGQIIESISLSSSSPSYEVSAAAKSAELLVAQSSSGCAGGIRDQIYSSGQSAGNKADVLRDANSDDGKAVAWALTFGKKALEDSLVAGTRNQTLQEIACVQPVQCDEPQDYSGQSEIRTNLFQLSGGTNQEIIINYEFYEIPDRMEVYAEGNLVESIPKGPGSTGGNSSDNPILPIQIPDGVEFLGIKLIGNENPNTRWDYTISCSGECDSQVASNSRNNESSTADEDWRFIHRTLGDYYTNNIGNSAAEAFAQQMKFLADGSSKNRAENGGWAGDFTRNTLLVAARDIAENRDFWDSPPPVDISFDSFFESQVGVSFTVFCNAAELLDITDLSGGVIVIDPYNNSDRAYTCGFARAGEHHIDRHLEQAFAQSIEQMISSIVEDDCLDEERLEEELKSAISNLRAEHSLLLDSVLVPGLERLPLPEFFQLGASDNWLTGGIPARAEELRERTLGQVLNYFVDQDKLSEEVLEGLGF